MPELTEHRRLAVPGRRRRVRVMCSRLVRAERPVPRFHFNVFDGYATEDRQGTELDNYETARRQAIALAGSVLIEESREPHVGNEWRVEVTDDQGLILYRLDIMIAAAAAVSNRQG